MRIVSLLPNATEIVHAVGLGDVLAGMLAVAGAAGVTAAGHSAVAGLQRRIEAISGATGPRP